MEDHDPGCGMNRSQIMTLPIAYLSEREQKEGKETKGKVPLLGIKFWMVICF